MSTSDNRITGIPPGSAKRDGVIGTALARQMEVTGDRECISRDDLAAFIDGCLTAGERERVLGHLAGCSRCAQVLSLSQAALQGEKRGTAGISWYRAAGVAAIAAVLALAVQVSLQRTPSPDVGSSAVTIAPPGLKGAPGPELQAAGGGDIPGAVAPAAPATRKTLPVRGLAALQLVTPEEATLPGVRNFGYAGSSRSSGPEITVIDPGGNADITSPTSLDIRFVPVDGVAIDRGSFKMEYMKREPVDLTARMKPYLGDDGVKVGSMRLPPGKHDFRVSIADVNGRISEKSFSVVYTVDF